MKYFQKRHLSDFQTINEFCHKVRAGGLFKVQYSGSSDVLVP